MIGVRSDGGLVAVRPGAPQPAYPADQPPKRRPVWPVPRVLAGTATWFGGLGLCREAAYPALDPSSGGCPAANGGCAGLPYLSLGSELLDIRPQASVRRRGSRTLARGTKEGASRGCAS